MHIDAAGNPPRRFLSPGPGCNRVLVLEVIVKQSVQRPGHLFVTTFPSAPGARAGMAERCGLELRDPCLCSQRAQLLSRNRPVATEPCAGLGEYPKDRRVHKTPAALPILPRPQRGVRNSRRLALRQLCTRPEFLDPRGGGATPAAAPAVSQLRGGHDLYVHTPVAVANEGEEGF